VREEVGEYGESVFKAIKLRVVSTESEQFWALKAGITSHAEFPIWHPACPM
jgi:hypothetical protein